MLKLKDLLNEEDIVKNKKTGNVYVVKQIDPAKHDKPTPAEIEKTKAANNGQLPKGEKPSTPTPQQPQQQKPQGQKLGGSDFKSSAEKPNTSTANKRPGADDMKLKNLMPGIDTSTKTLDQVSPMERMEISTNIDKLVAMTDKARANGEKPEYFNLCQVSVPGTNLYCDGNLGIDRNDMPQFKGDARPGSPASKLPKNQNGEVDGEAFFKELLVKDGIKVDGPHDVPPDRLKATQMNMVGDKVAGMYKGLEENPQNPDLTAPIYVSNDGYVLDGHHRWAAIVAYNAKHPDKPIPMKVNIINEPIKPLVKRANEYADYIGIEKKAAVAGQRSGTPQPSPEKKKVEVASIKGKTSGKNIQTIELNGGQVFGTIHRNTKMVDDIVDHVKSTIPKEKWKDIVFVGEGGTTNKSGEIEFNDEMKYAAPKFKEMGAGVDTFDGDELDVHKPNSKLYKKQIEKTGLNQSQVNAGNWASMIGQGEGTDTMKPATFLNDEGKTFLQDAAKEAGFPPIENWDEPTDQDVDTLYRLSFPEDNGDAETKVNDIQVAFNEIRDENIIEKNKELTAQGKIPITIAGEGHIELVKNMITKNTKLSEFSLRHILKSIK